MAGLIEIVDVRCLSCGAENSLEAEAIIGLRQSPRCRQCEDNLFPYFGRNLSGLSSEAYALPTDRVASKAVGKIPGVVKLLQIVARKITDRDLQLEHYADHLKVSDDQLPELHGRYRTAGDRLGFGELPELFVEQNPLVNAWTVGIQRPIVGITSGALEILSDEEQIALLGHELGHVQAGHVLYLTAAKYLTITTQAIPGPLDDLAVVAALTGWMRSAEVTADRAGVLAADAPDTMIRTLMKLAGCPPDTRSTVSVDAFIEQGRRFLELQKDGWLSKAMVLIDIWRRGHPFTSYRALEILEFVTSAHYRGIMQGDFKSHALVSTMPCPNCRHRVADWAVVCPSCAYVVSSDAAVEDREPPAADESRWQDAWEKVGESLGQAGLKATDWSRDVMTRLRKNRK